MMRFFGQIKMVLALVLLFVSSGWLAVPRDICITKALVQAGCSCAPAAMESYGCPCCDVTLKSGFGQCNGHDRESEAPAGEHHSSSCLLVSSEVSKISGSERAQPALPILDVVAVLPMEPVLRNLPVIAGFAKAEENLALNFSTSYRDNCVLLI